MMWLNEGTRSSESNDSRFSHLNPQNVGESEVPRKVWGPVVTRIDKHGIRKHIAPPTILHLDAPGLVNHHPPHMIHLTTAKFRSGTTVTYWINSISPLRWINILKFNTHNPCWSNFVWTNSMPSIPPCNNLPPIQLFLHSRLGCRHQADPWHVATHTNHWHQGWPGL